MEWLQGRVDLHRMAEQTWLHVNEAGLAELLCATVLPLLALLIGIRVNRWIDSRPQKTFHAYIVDFTAPLLAPTLTVIFLALAKFVFHLSAIDVFILPFVLKLSVAWLAISVVVIMSSRQSAGWMIALVIIPVTLLHLFGIWRPVTQTLSDVKFTVAKVELTAYGILSGIAAVIALFWVAGFIVSATDSRLRRMRRIHVSNRVLIMKFFQILVYFIVFLIGLQVLGVDLTAFSVLGGALGVGIGFGLQKIASNFISGIILLFEKSVQVDDLIELADGTRGFVRQTAARYSLLELADGREVFIPNEEFINARVITLTHSNRTGRIDIAVTVEYMSDVDRVCALLLQATQACKKCVRDPAPSAFLTGFGDHGLQFSLYFWLENVIEGTIVPRHEVMREIVRLFRADNIIIAYPHQVAVGDPALCQIPAKAPKPPKKTEKAK